MKKLILLATLLFGLQNFAQKTFEVYNYSNQTIKLADIITKPSGSATYPEFHSKPALISILPGGQYTLQNTSNLYRFPFYSPSSSPVISNWEKLDSPSSSTVVTSIVAWSLGNAQVFKNLKFFDGLDILREVGINNPSPETFSSGITAIYTGDQPDPIGQPNLWIYTVVIF